MPHTDLVTLDGQNYLITGSVVGQPVAEWETGLKVGKASYDSREHAFFLVLDDFSGGLGHRRLDIREELGTYWDTDTTAAGSPDLTRAGHVTLPPQQGSVTIAGGNPTGNDMTIRSPSYPYVNAGGVRHLVGLGSGIYSSTDGLTYTREDAGGADAAQVQAIVEYVTADGTVAHFAGYSSKTAATTGTARYKKSTNNGDTWANGNADKVLHDLFVWDEKLIAVWGKGIIFTTMATATEAEVWNIDDALDAEFIANVSSGHIHFIGVAQAPWGEPAIYFTDERHLWTLNFNARQAFEINIGLGGLFLPTMFSGYIVGTDGWNVWQYDPAGKTVRNMGFPRNDGVPPSLSIAGGQTVVGALFALDDRLYGIVQKPSNVTALFVHNGSGWSQVGDDITGFYSNFGFMAPFPPVGAMVQRRIFLAGAANTTSAAVALKFVDQPHLSSIPIAGTDTFGASGRAFLTGWIDGGFSELDGALFRMHCDAWNLTSTETIKVEYQLDNSESAAWTQMRDSSNVADVFDSLTKVLYFSSATPLRGVQFRTIRFRITLNRGGTATKSPELRALTLVYLKKPTLRMGWSFRIDVNRMIAEATTGSAWAGAATYQKVYDALRTVWNKKPLVDFDVPNVQTNMNVMLTNFTNSFDDFRDEIAARGYIEVTLLEPIVT